VRADGNNLLFQFGTVEVACTSTSAVLDSEKADADRVTFADVISGLDWQWFFVVTGHPDYAPGTFWTLCWETAAFVPVAYLFRPYGNAVATAQQPHFSGSATIDKKPPLGGDAKAVWAFDTRLTCTAQPTRVTA
jgi:hypothetical protein